MTSTAGSQRQALISGLKGFFFDEQVPYGTALVRMFLPAVALIPMTRRFFRVREIFSSDGAPQQLAELFGHGTPLPELSPVLASALYGLMLFAMVCGIFGFRTRMSFLIATPLYIYFNMLDAVGTMTKYSVIASHVLLILAVSNCGAVWSIDAILRKWREGDAATAIPPRFPVWPARLLQLLFCFIYFGAAITKIQTPEFFSGEQMRYWMFSNWNYPNPLGETLATWTSVLLISGYITVVWEITFPFLAWRPIGRYFALGIGAIFHFLTIFQLGLLIFPFICTACYLAFLMEKDIVAIRQFLRARKFPTSVIGVPRFAVARLIQARPAAIPLPALWLSLAMIVLVLSAEADYRLDDYGIRRNHGPLPLKKMDATVARTLINSQRPLREKDKFFSFDIGSMMMAGQLANRKTEFSYGDVVIAQCNINPPHEDLWVECVIEDDQNRIIDVAGQFVTRDQLYSSFPYQTGNKLVPGNYWVVLKSSGQEISRRQFTLSGDPESLPAMGQMLSN